MTEIKTSSTPEIGVPPKLIFDYYDEDEFKTFLDSLPSSVAVKVISKMQDVATIGLAKAVTKQVVKKVDSKKGIYELRVDTNGIFTRSLFFRLQKAKKNEDDGNPPTYIITNAFKKKTNKTQSKELKKAIKRKANYRNKR
ncbi:MAG: type II toxin-antitoxin system RelE/ParE family toxin [Streptococcus salivarius]